MQTKQLSRKLKSSRKADARNSSATSHIPRDRPYILPEQTIPAAKFSQAAVQTITNIPTSVTAKISQVVQTSRTSRSSVPTKSSQAVQTSQPYPRIIKDSPSKYTHVEPPPKKLRHSRFWAMDGSVVIDVHNTLFKLHRSRLTQQSDYFKNLFHDDSARGDQARRIEDGCPIYTVDCMSVTDFVQLLTSMDDAM